MFRRASLQSVRGYAIKVISQDSTGKVSSLTFKVNAGSRYSPKDGLSHLLSRFNFQNTRQRSALRLTRESELLGGEFSSHVDRDSIYLTANFLKESLPYYVNALSDVLYKTSFRPHELPETVIPAAKYDLSRASASPIYQANEALHNLSFRTGLGNPLHYDGVEPISLDEIKEFSDRVYIKDNIEIIAKGVNETDLKRFIQDSTFHQLPQGVSLLESSAPKFYEGVEQRIRAAGESVAAIAIPAKTSEFAAYEVLSHYLTSPLFQFSSVVSEAKLNKYNQAGLFTLFVKGDALSVSSAIKKVIGALKAGVELKSAIPYAETKLALENDLALTPINLNLNKVGNFKLGKFNYVTVGDVSKLPFADEL